MFKNINDKDRDELLARWDQMSRKMHEANRAEMEALKRIGSKLNAGNVPSADEVKTFVDML